MNRFALPAAALCIAASAQAQATPKREIPDSLLKKAKVTEKTATATAQARIPGGHVESVELEREGGKLIYSYDIKVAGKSGIDEVHVDAMTGKVLGVEHETPAMERKEEKKDKAATTKKP